MEIKSEYKDFKEKLMELANSGLRHGFSTLNVSSEVKDQKVHAVIEAGKKYKFTISKKDIE